MKQKPNIPCPPPPPPPPQIPEQLQFQPPKFLFPLTSATENTMPSFEDQQDNFSAQERESLKNAFRYICRLIFKEAYKYKSKIADIAEENGLAILDDHHFRGMFDCAQELSGERYFRKFVAKFDDKERVTICAYMRWFLIEKYLQYISEEGKGKRKMMKKHLYIKFKNEVMLPYIDSLI